MWGYASTFQSRGVAVGVCNDGLVGGGRVPDAASAAEHQIGVFVGISPDPVTRGAQTLVRTYVDDGENDPVTGVVLSQYFYDNGNLKFDAAATKAQSSPGVTCKFETIESEGTFQKLTCNLGSLDSFENKMVGAVITTSTNSEFDIEVDSNVETDDGSNGYFYTDFHTDAPSDTQKGGYVAPGKTITLGPKNPTADNPTVGGFTLPKKILNTFSTKPKYVPGPGANITVTADDPSTAPTACGGQPCDGVLFTVKGDGPAGSFPGYTDAKHPALMKIVFFGGSVPVNSTLYIIKEGVGVPAPACVKDHGAYVNTPCLVKHQVVKKTGKITDTIALLSGDPTGGRR